MHQVQGVALIDDAESLLQTKGYGVAMQEPVGHGMKSPGRNLPGPVGSHQGGQPPDHLVCGAPAERHQQDPVGRHPAVDEAGQASHERPGLPRPRPGDDEQRAAVVLGGAELVRIQPTRPERSLAEGNRWGHGPPQ